MKNMQSNEKQINYQKIIIAMLAILSLLAAVVKVFIGFDVDEGYAVSMPYRLLQGDKLLEDMWEIHQTSSFLPYFFIFPFVKLTGGNTGIVLYLRIVATLIHFGFSLWVYYGLPHNIQKEWRLLTALLYFNFLPKWLMNLDFSMQLIWGMTAMLLLLSHKKRESISLFFAGVSLAMTVLGYPTMAILYPVALWLIWKYHHKSMKKLGIFTLGCGACAIIFIGYLLSYMTVPDIIATIPHIFSDGSHQFDAGTKWALFFQRWLEAVIQAGILLVPTAAFAFLWKLVSGKFPEKRFLAASLAKEHFYFCFVLIFMLCSSLIVIFANVAGVSWGPFRLQVRYLVLFVMAFFLWKERNVKNYLLIGTLAAFAGIMLASNVGPVSSSSYLVIGIAGLVLLIYYYQREFGLKQLEVASYAVVSIFVLSLVFCKGYYVRVSEYPPANILEERKQVTFGPLKGIWIYPEDLNRAQDFYEVISEGKPEEKLLLLSTEGIYNLYSQGIYVLPTTISTPAFNEQWVAYFTIHEDRQPDRIIIGKNTVDDLDKFFANNPLGIWIGEHYDIINRKEDENLCLIQK